MNQPTQPNTADTGAGMYDLLAWLEVHKTKVALALVACLVLGVAVWLMSHLRAEKEQEANAELLALRGPNATEAGAPASAYLKVHEEFGNTPAGARALLLGASAYFTENQYDEAHKTFTRFLDEHSDSTFASAAAFGVAASLEALNRLDDALAAYQKVATQYSKSAEADNAKMAMARIYEVKNQPEQALKTLDELSRPAPGANANPAVISRREQLLKKHPHLRAAAPVTNAVPAAGPVTINSAPAATTNK